MFLERKSRLVLGWPRSLPYRFISQARLDWASEAGVSSNGRRNQDTRPIYGFEYVLASGIVSTELNRRKEEDISERSSRRLRSRTNLRAPDMFVTAQQ